MSKVEEYLKSENLPELGVEVSVDELRALAGKFGFYRVLSKLDGKLPSEPFICDGCTSFPDRVVKFDEGALSFPSIYPACFWHDLAYWLGGDEIDRLVADARLMVDVAMLSEVEIGELMFAGVRAAGKSHWRFVEDAEEI